MSKGKKISYIVMAALCIFFFLVSSTNLILKDEVQKIRELSILIPENEKEYLEYFKRGIQEAANENRADVNDITYQENRDPGEIMELLDREYESGVDAAVLVLEQEEENDLQEYLAKMRTVFPIITVNSFTSSETDRANITFEAEKAASDLAEQIAEEQGRDTDVVFLTTRGNISKELYRIFKKEFETYPYKIEEWDLTIQGPEAYLKYNQGKKVYIACWMDEMEAVLEVLGGRALYGIGYTNTICNAMREHRVTGVVAFSMYSIGVYAVQEAVTAVEAGTARESVHVPCRYITEKNLKEEQKYLFPMY